MPKRNTSPLNDSSALWARKIHISVQATINIIPRQNAKRFKHNNLQQYLVLSEQFIGPRSMHSISEH